MTHLHGGLNSHNSHNSTVGVEQRIERVEQGLRTYPHQRGSLRSPMDQRSRSDRRTCYAGRVARRRAQKAATAAKPNQIESKPTAASPRRPEAV